MSKETLVIVENAKSGRSKCRRCTQSILKDEIRVGIVGWISGRKAVMWQKPDCFVKGIRIDQSKSSRGKCKLSGESFVKGEKQLVLSVHNTESRVKLSRAGEALRDYLVRVRNIKPEEILGCDELDNEQVESLRSALMNATSESGRNHTKRVVPPSSAEKPARKKAKRKEKNEPVTKRTILTRRDIPLGSWSFKIVSWNVDGLRAPGRLEGLARLAKEEMPDLIVLQETKLQHVHATQIYSKCPDEYDTWWFCSTAKKGYSGTAVLTRKKSGKVNVKGVGPGTYCAPKQPTAASFFAKTKTLSSPSKRDSAPLNITFGCGEKEADAEGRSITVEYENFIVVALYVPNSGQKLQRLSYRTNVWDMHLRKYVDDLEKSTGKPVIVTGDLNVAHRNVDVYNYYAKHLKTQSGCTEEERASFTSWLKEWDRKDALRELYGDGAEAQYTYWSTRAGNRVGNRGLRLDYFVVPSKIIDADDTAVRLHDCYTIPDGFGGGNTRASRTPSDHCPIACVLTDK